MQQMPQGNERTGILSLANPGLSLDLTSDRWNLGAEYASVLDGVDVRRMNTLRPLPPRISLGASLPEADLPLRQAWGINMEGNVPLRLAGRLHENMYDDRTSMGTGDPYHWFLLDELSWFPTGYSHPNALVRDVGLNDTRNINPGEQVVVFYDSSGTITEPKIATVVGHESDASIEIYPPISDTQIGIADSGTDPDYVQAIILETPYHWALPKFQVAAGSPVAPVWHKDRLVRYPTAYQLYGEWPQEIIGGWISINQDKRYGNPEVRRIESIGTTFATNDTIFFDVDLTNDWEAFDKFNILYRKRFEKTGVLVTNGIKWWLYADGEYMLLMDLGTDGIADDNWEVGQISSYLMMLTNPSRPSRILRLDRLPGDSVAHQSTLAGTTAPTRERSLESQGDDDGQTEKTFQAADISDSGNVGVGIYRVLGRMRGELDGLESPLFPIYDSDDGDDRDINVTTGNDVLQVVATSIQYWPLYHARWTALELFRTEDEGADYFLERTIDLVDLWPEAFSTYLMTKGLLTNWPFADVEATFVASDAVLARNTQLSDATDDFVAGKPPPICKQAVNIQGITFCFGAAEDDAPDPVFKYARPITLDNDSKEAGLNYEPSTGEVFTDHTPGTNPFDAPGGPAAEVGDVVEFIWPQTFAGYQSEVVSVSGGLFVAPDLGEWPTTLWGGTGGDTKYTRGWGHLLKEYPKEWPRIESDESVWYSRTDKFAPESFTGRTLELSRFGDTFRKALPMANYIAVIMDQGVHMIYFDSDGTLATDHVSTSGAGTPWKHSVVAFENLVIWANTDGPMVMTVSNSPNAEGHRGTIKPLPGAERVRQWFLDAYAAEQRIDAGVDVTEKIVRFRKRIDDNTFESLEFSLRTQRWTRVHDDAGDWYVSARQVEGSAAIQMYSVDDSGHIFRVVSSEDEDPYPGKTVQAETDSTWVVEESKIRKAGKFTADMAGDVVRFVSTSGDVDGEARVIRTASADQITFDIVPGLTSGDTFIIGATRFKVRFPPILPSQRINVITVDGGWLRALPTYRQKFGVWSNQPRGEIMLRAFRNFSDDAIGGVSSRDYNEISVPVFDESDTEEISVNRAAPLHVDGNSLELEIEHISARSDFALEILDVELTESGDYLEKAE